MKEDIEKILGRDLKKEDGISLLEIVNIELKLGQTIPEPLKEFCLSAGKVELFMDGFQHFAEPSELLVLDDKLLFLQENQSVVYWAAALDDTETVYITQDIDAEEGIEWEKEEFGLTAFLKMMLYFQCLMSDESFHERTDGGYKFFASLDADEYYESEEARKFIEDVNESWENIITGNGVSIFMKDSTLLMYFIDSQKKVNGMMILASKDGSVIESAAGKYGFMTL